MKQVICALCSLAILLVVSPAQAEQTAIRVGVQQSIPHVIEKSDGSFYGSDLSFWQAIADETGWEDFQYIKYQTLPDLLAAVEAGDVDVAMAGISKTEDRETRMDFSHSYNSTGLQIMVNKKVSEVNTIWRVLGNWDVQKIVLSFIGFCMVLAFLFWLIERKLNDSVPKGVFDGLLTCNYFAVVLASSTGFGDVTPVTRLGKVLVMIGIIIGFGYFGAFLGIFSSEWGDSKDTYRISTPMQLRGQLVATRAGSTSVGELSRLGADVDAQGTLEQAFAKLEKAEVRAVVFDAPNLLYYEKNVGQGMVAVVGDIFANQEYGFAFPEGSTLVEPVNRALLTIKHKGIYDRVYTEWFGN